MILKVSTATENVQSVAHFP